MQPIPTLEVSDMQQQTDAMQVVACLNQIAIDQGLTLTPHWSFIGGNLVDGALRSDDNTAIRLFDSWRDILGGGGRLHSYSYTSHFEGGTTRKVWVVNTIVHGVSVRFTADVPHTVDATPVTAPLQLAHVGPVGVAA